MFQKLKGKLMALSLSAVAAIAALPVAAGAAPIDFSTQTSFGFTPQDVVGTGFSFMGMFDEYTMLVLGAIFAPVAVGLLIWLFRKLPKGGGSRA